VANPTIRPETNPNSCGTISCAMVIET
jgi:hypothetical protein